MPGPYDSPAVRSTYEKKGTADPGSRRRRHCSGTIYKLLQCGYSVLVLETEMPSAIRRYAAFSEAVYDGVSRVEDKTCRLAEISGKPEKLWKPGRRPCWWIRTAGC